MEDYAVGSGGDYSLYQGGVVHLNGEQPPTHSTQTSIQSTIETIHGVLPAHTPELGSK
jgi:hypothetical protein